MVQNISSSDAWAMLQADPSAQLIDVRTMAEWQFVGLPDLASLGRSPVLIEWQRYPAMTVNQDFLPMLEQAGLRPDQTLLFLCKVGGRSLAAGQLAEQAGYRQCINVADGFEGGLDAAQHRGNRTGWKASGLPWRQG